MDRLFRSAAARRRSIGRVQFPVEGKHCRASHGIPHFGPDGMLYFSNGDGTSYNFMDPRTVRAQDIHNLSGKVLRIDPITGAGVPGNPFYDPADPNSNQSKVFCSGVRNAYRFTFDPVTNLPVVGDVGWTTWEEISTGPAGSNFGWPYLEGPGRTGSYENLAQAISFYNNGNRNSPSDQAAVFPLLSRSHAVEIGRGALLDEASLPSSSLASMTR
ncbi:PQQ-dependent sugar dehydrogenase [Pararhizobium sp. LjRoot255]|uniref:PQQ-dependent sugar dehydrogenase n=1 Tax=Pararhizobium sp. LjRoot255 TaxID=3342298 RepID=UPI003ECEB33C